MKKTFLFTFFFAFFGCANAQNHSTCDGNRYRSEVFTEVEVTTGIKYGENTTYASAFQELFLDVYEPANDTAEMRPVIILGFGGSFISGTRQDLDMLCRDYARMGYVAVTIDYRLYDGPLFPIPTGEQMTEVVVKTIGDMKAAIRFMREDAATADNYRIDPDVVFVGGISAGSIMASHTAVIDSTDTFTPELEALLAANGGFEGNSSSNYEYSSEVLGYVNFSGALNDASWIDSDDPPFFSVHDDGDQVVPYGEGFASIFGFDIVYVEGSSVMSATADAAGVNNELQTIENSNGHVSYFFSPESRAQYVGASAEFLYELICADFMSNTNNPEVETIDIFPNPTTGRIVLANENFDGVQVFNAFGKQVSSAAKVKEINIGNLAQGVYLLKMQRGADRYQSRVVLKN